MHNVIHIVDASKGPFLPRDVSGESCGICAYYDPYLPCFGQCKRHAPVSPGAGSITPVWPRVEADDWCGDFARVIEKGGDK